MESTEVVGYVPTEKEVVNEMALILIKWMRHARIRQNLEDAENASDFFSRCMRENKEEQLLFLRKIANLEEHMFLKGFHVKNRQRCLSKMWGRAIEIQREERMKRYKDVEFSRIKIRRPARNFAGMVPKRVREELGK